MWLTSFFCSAFFFISFTVNNLLLPVNGNNELPPVTITSTANDELIIIQNGYVQMELSGIEHSILSISADYNGNGDFTSNTLIRPITLEIVTETCSIVIFNNKPIIQIINNSEELAILKISSTNGCKGRNTEFITESWTISLPQAYRGFDILMDGEVLSNDDQVRYISHGIYSQSASVYGLYDRGVAQMMNSHDQCLVSDAALGRMYFLGNGTSLDVLFRNKEHTTILMTSHNGIPAGMQSLIVGNISNITYDMKTAWRNCHLFYTDTRDSFIPSSVEKGQKWSIPMELIPNNANFPAFAVVNVHTQPVLKSITDLQTYLMGIYASPAGCFKSYYSGWNGTIAPTIAHPDTGYSPDTNFFDPDNFITLSAALCKF